MRINLPVTQQELQLKPEHIIVSRTDLKGLITYANRDFVEISGFTEAELMRAPHNLVRHPDMPAVAFKDLWDTLKAGRPWSGLVKNRRKNGDHYWVEAHATPIWENGKLTCYQSVRRMASRADIDGAEALYRAVREGTIKGVEVKQGAVVSARPWARAARRWRDLGIAPKAAMIIGLLPVVLALLGVLQVAGMNLATGSIIGALATAVVFQVLAATMWIHSLKAPVNDMVTAFRNLAEGRYDTKLDIRRNDEMGRLLQNLHAMQVRMGFERDEAGRVAERNLAIRTALDGTSSSLMMLDDQHQVQYWNQALQRIFAEHAAAIAQDVKGFDAAQLTGKPLTLLDGDPALRAKVFGPLAAPLNAHLALGGREFDLVITPVSDTRGHRLGTTIEWKDRTAEIAVEQAIRNVVDGAVQGDFTGRMELQSLTGFHRDLALGVNQLMSVSQAGLDALAGMLSALAQGNLGERIATEFAGTFGQLRDDANSTATQLSRIIGQIREASESIHTAASEIAAGNADLSRRTEQQASSLQETAASMEELTGTVKQNADNARQANALAVSASDVAREGGQAMHEVVSTMGSISDSAKKIEDIIGVIDGIAFQTNILALNAAVEAARAGEQGRGFAVVASEVRNLAQRSASAAKEIKGLIGESVAQVQDGSRLVNAAGKTMEDVVQSVQRVADIISEITAASMEQSSGIEQVNQAIAQMDQVTQQNAALVEQAAAAAESMEDQARGLTQSVAVFRLRDAEPRSGPKPGESANRLRVVGNERLAAAGD